MSSCHTWLKSLTVVENSFTDEPPKMNEKEEVYTRYVWQWVWNDKAKGEFFRHENVAKSDIYTHRGKEAIGKIVEIRNGAEVPP